MPLVYEAMNETLKEFFVGLTELPLNQLEARHKIGLPAVIAHWKLGAHRIIYREVEHDLSDSKAFVEGYAKNMQKNGWKSITEQLSHLHKISPRLIAGILLATAEITKAPGAALLDRPALSAPGHFFRAAALP